MKRMTWLALLCALLAAPAGAEELTREMILQDAEAFAEHIWTPSLDNVVAPCSHDWICDWEVGVPVVGLPYDWGGYKTLEEFEQDLIDGLGAGSHSRHGILDCTTGLDCSGFVSQVWRCGRHTTSNMIEVSHPIDGADILPGDAYNKAGSHVVLWVEESPSGQPVFYEATGDPISRTLLREDATWSYLEGYMPLRLDTLEDGPPLTEGTKDSPIEIRAFPFEDHNNTALSTESDWDRYACAPDKREEGPEILYTFELTEVGDLNITVEDPIGVDVDVHLLASKSADDCLARDDTHIAWLNASPGRYYVSADTWTKESGEQLPGPYDLRVTFKAAAAPQEDAGVQPQHDTTTGHDAAGGLDTSVPVDSLTGGGGGGGGCTCLAGRVGFYEILIVLLLIIGTTIVFRNWRA
jgi:hypothetical protein